MHFISNLDFSDYLLLDTARVKAYYPKLLKSLFSVNDTIVFSDIHKKTIPSFKAFDGDLIFEFWGSAWAGTEIFDGLALIRGYSPSKALFDLFFSYDFFNEEGHALDLEDQIDISFYFNEVCLLFTTSHERLVYIKRDFYEDLIIKGSLGECK